MLPTRSLVFLNELYMYITFSNTEIQHEQKNDNIKTKVST